MQITRLDPARLGEIQPLFRQVFGHEISIEFLEWKYGKGFGESWGCVEDDGRLALHCGVSYRDTTLNGKQFRVAQLVDLMAAPKQSGLSRGDSPFALLMRAVLSELRTPTNPEALAFGFPSNRAMRLGEKVGVFRAIDEWLELYFPACRAPFFYRAPEPVVAIDPPTARIIDRLWQTMARDLADFPVGIRDAAYVSRRYIRHPEHQYCCLLVRSYWLRQPVGMAVLRGNEADYELLDIIGPLSTMPEVLRCLQSWLHGRGGTAFKWFLTSRFAQRFAPFAASCQPTEFRIMANPLSSPAIVDKFDHKWWLTGGDTDYR